MTLPDYKAARRNRIVLLASGFVLALLVLVWISGLLQLTTEPEPPLPTTGTPPVEPEAIEEPEPAPSLPKFATLHEAAYAGSTGEVKRLLEAGADPNAYGQEGTRLSGDTALRWASFFGHSEVVKLLLEAGADPNAQYHVETPGTALISAASCAQSTIMGDDPSDRHADFTGECYETMKLLLEAGADPDGRSRSKWTALHLVVGFTKGHALQARYINLLLDAGADPNLKNDFGERPLYFAEGTPAEFILRKAGARP